MVSHISKSLRIPERNIRHMMRLRKYQFKKIDDKIVVDNVTFTKMVNELSE